MTGTGLGSKFAFIANRCAFSRGRSRPRIWHNLVRLENLQRLDLNALLSACQCAEDAYTARKLSDRLMLCDLASINFRVRNPEYGYLLAVNRPLSCRGGLRPRRLSCTFEVSLLWSHIQHTCPHFTSNRGIRSGPQKELHVQMTWSYAIQPRFHAENLSTSQQEAVRRLGHWNPPLQERLAS